jgi:hypothetical protein
MLAEIPNESIATPPSHYFHYFKRHSLHQVEQRGTDPDTVPLEVFQASKPGSGGNSFDEGRFGEGTKTASVSIGEEVIIGCWAVDVAVVI